METHQPFFKRLPYPILSTGLTLAIGLAIPVVYKWGDSSRIYGRELYLLRAALVILTTTVVLSVVWVILQKRFLAKSPESLANKTDTKLSPTIRSTRSIQFGTRSLLILTAFVALLMAVSPLFSKTWHGPILIVFIISIFCWAIIYQRSKLPLVYCWLAGMYLPFAWVFPFSKPFGGSVSGMAESLPVYPGLIPGLFLGRLYDSHSTDGPALFIVVVIALVTGTLLMRRGGKLALAFITCSTILSTLTSMFLHVMYRA